MPATQISVILLLILHLLQYVAYPEVMNLRTSLAVSGFLLMATFATHYGGNTYSIPLLQLFGLFGALVIMAVLHLNA